MFDMRAFLKENLVNGYWNGSFTREQVNIFGMNYLMKGMLTQGDFQEIQELITEPIPEEPEDVV